MNGQIERRSVVSVNRLTADGDHACASVTRTQSVHRSVRADGVTVVRSRTAVIVESGGRAAAGEPGGMSSTAGGYGDEGVPGAEPAADCRDATGDCFDPESCCDERERQLIAVLRAYLRPEAAPECLLDRLRATLDHCCCDDLRD